MLRTLHLCLKIEYQQKELFQQALIDHKINFEMPGGKIPKKVSPFDQDLGIIPCYYYLNESKDWKDILQEHRNTHQNDALCAPFDIFILQNHFINDYLNQFIALEKVKSFFIPTGSHLLCSYDDYIQHEDVISFGSETINNLSKLGLGIDYNHACYDD